MARKAVRVGDPHTCKAHGGGPVLPPCAAEVLIENEHAARMGDLASCGANPPDAIVGGTTQTLIENKGATRVREQTAHKGKIEKGALHVLIGKVLTVRVVIIKGSCW